MRVNYDFANGVRGKYAKKFKQGTNLILLAPDVLAVFPSSNAVNKALRELMKIAKKASKVAAL